MRPSPRRSAPALPPTWGHRKLTCGRSKRFGGGAALPEAGGTGAEALRPDRPGCERKYDERPLHALPPASAAQLRLDADQLLYAAARARFCEAYERERARARGEGARGGAQGGGLSLPPPPACRRPCSVFMAGAAGEREDERERADADGLLRHWRLLGQGQDAWLTSLLVRDPPAGRGNPQSR